MNIDEYKERVIELIKSGDPEFLKSAAECVLYCSESSFEIAASFDLVIFPEDRDVGAGVPDPAAQPQTPPTDCKDPARCAGPQSLRID